MSTQLQAFSEAKDSELFEVGNVSENDFLNDIHSAVENGEGAPPKADPTGTEPPPAEPTPGGQADPFANPAPDPQPFFQGQPAGQAIPVNNIVSAEIAFSLVDKVLPLALVYILSMLSVKANAKEMQATAADKKIIVPVLDNAMRELKLNFDNPFVALGAVLLGVYGSKAMEIYMEREKEPSKPQNAYQAAGEVKRKRGRPRNS